MPLLTSALNPFRAATIKLCLNWWKLDQSLHIEKMKVWRYAYVFPQNESGKWSNRRKPQKVYLLCSNKGPNYNICWTASRYLFRGRRAKFSKLQVQKCTVRSKWVNSNSQVPQLVEVHRLNRIYLNWLFYSNVSIRERVDRQLFNIFYHHG